MLYPLACAEEGASDSERVRAGSLTMTRERNKPLVPDAELWLTVARSVKPLPGREMPPEPAPERRPAPETPPRPRVQPKPAAKTRPAAALDHGRLVDLDRRTGERLARGRLPIEATLDLHGMTQEKAHRTLQRFLTRSAEAGLRCVLVVTGKGRGKEEGGVLKREVPRWLNEPDLRPLLLAMTYARPQHGGTGALYLLLKRRREG